MAMVRMTMDIMDEVIGKIRQVYDKKLDDYRLAHKNSNWGQRIYDHVVGPHERRITAAGVHSDFLNYAVELNLQQLLQPSGPPLELGLGYKLEPPRIFPPGRSSDVLKPYLVAQSYYGTYFSVNWVDNDLTWQQLYTELSNYATGLASIKGEAEAAKTSAQKVMRANSTVKGALEDWPALLDLLPHRVIEEHNAPPKPRAKPAPKEHVDTTGLNALTAHLTMEKLTK